MMLKKRVIPVLLLKDGRMVKGTQFTGFRDVGDPRSAIRVYSAQDADELIFLNINGVEGDLKSVVNLLNQATEECFMPLVAGGGVSKIEHVRELLLAGADKVFINTAGIENPKLLTDVAKKFGRQCLVGGIDYRQGIKGARVWIHNGKEETRLDPHEHAQNLVKLGVGEIFLNCIDHDGLMQGYDLDFIETIASSIPIPLIANGGAGNFGHLADLFNKTAAAAAGCSSLFHFGDNNPIRARAYLRNAGIPMRVLK